MANHVYFNIDLDLDAGQHELVEKLAESCFRANILAVDSVALSEKLPESSFSFTILWVSSNILAVACGILKATLPLSVSIRVERLAESCFNSTILWVISRILAVALVIFSDKDDDYPPKKVA